MATATFDKIATTTLASTATSITFSSIPGTYTDLRLVFLSSTAAGGAVLRYTLNGDSATNYSVSTLVGNRTGGAVTSSSGTSQTYGSGVYNYSSPATVPVLSLVDIFSYANTSVSKTILTSSAFDNNTAGTVQNTVVLWRSTAAITTILLASGGTSWDIGSTATLYGIKAA